MTEVANLTARLSADIARFVADMGVADAAVNRLRDDIEKLNRTKAEPNLASSVRQARVAVDDLANSWSKSEAATRRYALMQIQASQMEEDRVRKWNLQQLQALQMEEDAARKLANMQNEGAQMDIKRDRDKMVMLQQAYAMNEKFDEQQARAAQRRDVDNARLREDLARINLLKAKIDEGVVGRGGGGGGGGGGFGAATGLFGGILPGGARASAGAVSTALGLLLAVGPGLVAGAGGLGAGAVAGGGALAGTAGVLGLAFANLTKQAFTTQKAFDKLTPVQQQFVQNLRSLDAGLVKSLEGRAQGIVLPGLTAGINAAVTPASVNVLTQAVTQFSKAVSSGAQSFGAMLGSTQFTKSLGEVLKADAQYANDFFQSLAPLADAFVRIAQIAIPFTNWLDKKFKDLASDLDAWTRSAKGTTEIKKFFDDAKQSLEALWNVVKGVGNLFKSLFDATGMQNSISVINAIASVFNLVAAAIEKNKNLIRDFITIALGGLKEVFGVAFYLVDVFSKLLSPVDKLIRYLGQVTNGFVSLQRVGEAAMAVIFALMGKNLIASNNFIRSILGLGPAATEASAVADASLAVMKEQLRLAEIQADMLAKTLGVTVPEAAAKAEVGIAASMTSSASMIGRAAGTALALRDTLTSMAGRIVPVAIALSFIPPSNVGQKELDQVGLGWLGRVPFVGGAATQIENLLPHKYSGTQGWTTLWNDITGHKTPVRVGGDHVDLAHSAVLRDQMLQQQAAVSETAKIHQQIQRDQSAFGTPKALSQAGMGGGSVSATSTSLQQIKDAVAAAKDQYQTELASAQTTQDKIAANRAYATELRTQLAALKEIHGTQKEMQRIDNERLSIQHQLTAAQNKAKQEQQVAGADTAIARALGLASGQPQSASQQSLQRSFNELMRKVLAQPLLETSQIKNEGAAIAHALAAGVGDAAGRAEIRTALDNMKSDISTKMKDITAAAKAHSKEIADAIKAAAAAAKAAAKQAVSDYSQVLDQQISQLINAANTAFDQQTNNTVKQMRASLSATVKGMQDQLADDIKNLQITVVSAAGSFKYGGAITTTSAEDALNSLVAAHEDASRQMALTQAQQQLVIANAGGDPATIAAARQQFADAQYAIQVADLQKQADIQKTAAQSQLSDAQNAMQDKGQAKIDAYQQEQEDSITAYEHTRQLQKEAMDNMLADLQTAMKQYPATAHQQLNAMIQVFQDNGILGDLNTSSFVVGKTVYNGLKDGLSPIYKEISNLLSALSMVGGSLTKKDTLSGYFQSGSGQYGSKPLPMADGGVGTVTGPTLFLAGEAGPEQFAFSGGGRTFGGGGGGTTVPVQMHNHIYIDGKQVSTVVRNHLIRLGKSNNTIFTGNGITA